MRTIINKMNLKLAGEASGSRVPADLQKALAANPKAKVWWSDLTPNERRDFVGWIDGAKDPEARTQRIEKACVTLMAGYQRP
jgi:uncharacterized protein YdeI (YjbR/CyaY-like superfamily)